MAGKRRPMDVNLSVIDGGKHWTKTEIENRKASEPKLPKPKTLTPPAWLGKSGKTLFRKYAKQLLSFPSGIVSTLDVGTLARYCDCELSYAEACKHRGVWMAVCEERLVDLRDTGDLCSEQNDEVYEKAKAQIDFWTGQMVKFEKMARSCATEMGLTVSSRCRLVVPKAESNENDDPLAALQRKLAMG